MVYQTTWYTRGGRRKVNRESARAERAETGSEKKEETRDVGIVWVVLYDGLYDGSDQDKQKKTLMQWQEVKSESLPADFPRPRAAVRDTVLRSVFSAIASTKDSNALAWSRVRANCVTCPKMALSFTEDLKSVSSSDSSLSTGRW